ncbi:MAG: U32 family peptidase, partial [Bacteroidales bacterium]|nr:U32 family peptidase [Bacteroidales bacterium]
MQRNIIELLAPAKNLECGRAAIDHGADAVYIGAPQFGARKAAANTIGDIAQLADYAHTFGARVHVALNTLLFDHEVPDAKRLAWELYRAGADVLIVQDMALLAADMPPIELHASTQCDNRSPEKVLFWQRIGMGQVVLARELSIKEIANIAKQTTVRLEAFVHGALCVSYSGQCYMSLVRGGRSANRGE